MSDVKRYGTHFEWDGSPHLALDDEGEYVSHADYQALLLRLSTLEKVSLDFHRRASAAEARLNEVLADRSTAREHLQRERDRADEAEARLDLLWGQLGERDQTIAGLVGRLDEALKALNHIKDPDCAVERQEPESTG